MKSAEQTVVSMMCLFSLLRKRVRSTHGDAELHSEQELARGRISWTRNRIQSAYSLRRG
jgi:hypothetical protein